MRKYIVGLIGCIMVAYLAFYYPLIVKALGFTFFLASIIALIHAKRVCLYSCSGLDVFTALKGNALSIVGSYIIPAKTSELIRPYYYSQKKSINFVQGTVAVIVERFYDVITFLILVPIFLSLFADKYYNHSYINKDILFYYGVCALALVFFVISFKRGVLFLISYLPGEKIRGFLQTFYESFRTSIISSLSLYQLFLTLIVWFGSWFSYWLFLYYSGGPPIDFINALYVFIIATLGVTFTVTPGGIGTYEALMTFTLKSYGYSTELALACAVGLRLMYFIPNFLIVLYVLVIEEFDFSRRLPVNGNS